MNVSDGEKEVCTNNITNKGFQEEYVSRSGCVVEALIISHCK